MRIDVTMTASEVTRELGLRLAQLRIARNLTQAQLARKAGVGLSSVIRLERGCESVGLDIFIAVCSALALTGNFDQLVPPTVLTPLQILEGARLPKRSRKRKVRTIKWGDEQ